MRGRITEEQVKLLSQALDPARVKQSQGQSHLEGWDVRAHLTRIFGFDGWDEEILTETLLYEHLGNELKPDKKQWYVTYRVHSRLTIWGLDAEGNRAVAKVSEGGAVGGAENQPSHADAHDLAYKEAMTQALKRCAINLGNQFGLSLYDGGSVASVAAPIETVPEGAVEMRDATTRVKGAVDIAWPNAAEDFRKATANAIWKEAEAAKKLVEINGARYLLADEVKLLDAVCKDEIKRLLEAPRTDAA